MTTYERTETVEALCWNAIPGLRDGCSGEDVAAWINTNGGIAHFGEAGMYGRMACIVVMTAGGYRYATAGDYVVRRERAWSVVDAATFEREGWQAR